MSAITLLEWLVATDVIGRSMLVGQRPMKSLLRLSVRSSSFLKIGSLIFSDIIHVDSWPWYLVIDVASFLKKYFDGPNLGPMGLNQAQNEVAILLSLDHTFSLKVHTVIACASMSNI